MPKKVNRYNLSLSQKQQIERMYFGPYDNEWRDEKGNVLNTDQDIAKRMDLPYTYILAFSHILIEERNRTGKPVFLEYDRKYPKYVIVTLESKINEQGTEESSEEREESLG